MTAEMLQSMQEIADAPIPVLIEYLRLCQVRQDPCNFAYAVGVLASKADASMPGITGLTFQGEAYLHPGWVAWLAAVEQWNTNRPLGSEGRLSHVRGHPMQRYRHD